MPTPTGAVTGWSQDLNLKTFHSYLLEYLPLLQDFISWNCFFFRNINRMTLTLQCLQPTLLKLLKDKAIAEIKKEPGIWNLQGCRWHVEVQLSLTSYTLVSLLGKWFCFSIKSHQLWIATVWSLPQNFDNTNTLKLFFFN